MMYPTEWPQFFTATIQGWKHCLKDNRNKDIIIDCLQTMVRREQIELNAFVILSNHVHIIWQPLGHHTPQKVHSSFTNFTGKQIKNSIAIHEPALLQEMKSKNLNREYQVWKRRSLSIELSSDNVFMQKLEYIHDNPVRAGLALNAEDYYYSSASFYHDGIDHFGMLTHYLGEKLGLLNRGSSEPRPRR